jgi:predicted MFS family arabinose efflux permease
LLVVGLVLAGTSSGWIWAPYSDAIGRLLPDGSRERVLAIIPSGTAFAVVIAGPLALLARATGWRFAWFVFAAIALAATVYNAVLLPGGSTADRARRTPNMRWFARRRAVPLYLTALSYGLLGSVYWTYAVEAISGTDDPDTGPLFWTLMGLSGTAGVFTGRVLARLGLPGAHRLLLTALATAVALIGIAPGALVAVAASALLYGCAFMATSGLLAVWSYQVFPEYPATGFSATVLFLGVGSVAGPVTMGVIASQYGLRATFLLTAALALLTLLAAPSPRPARVGVSASTPKQDQHGP